MTRWWGFERTGNPFLLVRKMLVGRMAALIGSPSHLSINVSDGRSSPISIASQRQKKSKTVSIHCLMFNRQL